jgi:hypothetical protein
MTLPPLQVQAHGSIRVNLALAHLRAALTHARDCEKLESEHTWPATQEILDRHFACASGAIVGATCGLEAALNEFHQDAIDGSDASLGLAAAARSQIVDLWDTVDRAPLLRKFSWILSLANAPPLSAGVLPYQSAASVIALRDALVHYKPEWYHDLERSKRLEDRLRGQFPLNRLCADGMAFVPYRACGHGSGVWACRSVVHYLTEFYEKLALQPKKLAQMKAAL